MVIILTVQDTLYYLTPPRSLQPTTSFEIARFPTDNLYATYGEPFFLTCFFLTGKKMNEPQVYTYEK
jgi:hypothetical protein